MSSYDTAGIELETRTKEYIYYTERKRVPYKKRRWNPQTKRMETVTLYKYITVVRQDTRMLFKFNYMLGNCNGFLDQGQYCYPFSFQIPPGLPGSFEYYDNNTIASIVYSVTAKAISISNRSSKVKGYNILIVRQPQESFNYLPQATINRQMSSCCQDKGKVEFGLSYNKNGFFPGDKLEAIICLDNKQCTLNCKSIKLAIMQSITVRKLGYKAKTKTREVCGSSYDELIAPGQFVTKNFNIRVDDECNPVIGYIHKCKHLNLFKDTSIISKWQASCKSILITCRYYVTAFAQYEGCCSDKPTITNDVLYYIPETIDNYIFVKPEGFNPVVYSSASIEMPPYDPNFSQNYASAKVQRVQQQQLQQPQSVAYQGMQVPPNQNQPFINQEKQEEVSGEIEDSDREEPMDSNMLSSKPVVYPMNQINSGTTQAQQVPEGGIVQQQIPIEQPAPVA